MCLCQGSQARCGTSSRTHMSKGLLLSKTLALGKDACMYCQDAASQISSHSRHSSCQRTYGSGLWNHDTKLGPSKLSTTVSAKALRTWHCRSSLCKGRSSCQQPLFSAHSEYMTIICEKSIIGLGHFMPFAAQYTLIWLRQLLSTKTSAIACLVILTRRKFFLE